MQSLEWTNYSFFTWSEQYEITGVIPNTIVMFLTTLFRTALEKCQVSYPRPRRAKPYSTDPSSDITYLDRYHWYLSLTPTDIKNLESLCHLDIVVRLGKAEHTEFVKVASSLKVKGQIHVPSTSSTWIRHWRENHTTAICCTKVFFRMQSQSREKLTLRH